jgi:hypothetical protein
MTIVNVSPPTEGHILIKLDWETASALTRVLGKVNGGHSKAAGLSDIYDTLEAHFGNDRKATGKWKSAYIKGTSLPQIYLSSEKDTGQWA